jgi:hypothetical protein
MKKLARSYLKEQTGWHMPVITTMWEEDVGRLRFKVGPRPKQETLSEK